MRKYVDIERFCSPENLEILSNPEDELTVEEKIDGGNGCFFLQDGELHFCSRNRDLTEEKDGKTFSHQIAWLKQRLAGKEVSDQFYYYIEWMQKHSISYGLEVPQAVGLDIMPKEGAFGKTPAFLGRKSKEIEFEKLGVPVIALKGIYKTKELTEEKMNELLATSAY